MNSTRSSSHNIALTILFCAIFAFTCSAVSAEEATATSDWKADNTKAIAAMRGEKYEESEQLFQKALSECKLAEDKKVVSANMALLLKKLGRDDEAEKLLGEEAAPKQGNAKSDTQMHSGTVTATAKRTGFVEINSYMKQLDESIQKADQSGDLETLQGLFQKKADAIKLKEGESLDYSYALHYRAQVLQHMHRDAEAATLDQYATRIRDKNRRAASANQARMNQAQAQAQFNASNAQMNFLNSPFSQAPLPSRLPPLKFDFDKSPPLPNPMGQQEYTTPSQHIDLEDARKNAIDRSGTTNIQKTIRKFGQF